MSEAEPRSNANTNANIEVARLFAEIGDILELKGEPPYRVQAYRSAARSIGKLNERLESLFQQGRLRQVPGIGQALEAKIVEYLSTGHIESYEQLRRDFPVALASLLQVPGLGPGRARTLYRELGISNVAELEQAARDGRLQAVPGFGERARETLLASLERLKRRTTRSLISDGWLAAQQVREALGLGTVAGASSAADGSHASPDDRIAVVGSVRRMQDSIGNLDLLAARDDQASADQLLERLVKLPNLIQVLERRADFASVRLYGGLDVRLFIVPRSAWGSGLVWYTGSQAHVAHLERLASERGWRLSPAGLEDATTGKRLGGETEQGIYDMLGLPWIAPELREGTGEIEAGLGGTLPRLVTLDDIKGDLHTHTNWTDGTQPLDEMARAARARGYQYMALTDHTQNLTVTRGLSPERLREQRALVDRINHQLAPFVVLLGTEMDILMDGQLDFSDEVLASLDYVSASIHTGFRQPREVMTARILRALGNPLVDTLNHPHGRKIGRREGYAVDMQAVIETAARTGCALELNATPDRLDLNGVWARRAQQLGAQFTISSDAHAVDDFEYMQFGVGSARRGWLAAADVLNTRPLDELRALLAQHRRNGRRATH